MVTRAEAKQGWRGNMSQQRQHAVVKLGIKPYYLETTITGYRQKRRKY